MNETQTPQVDVTQSPKPHEEASQAPSVPGKSSDPATESPDIPKTPNPPTLTPDVPASETPSVTSTPGPIGTETPDVPKTPGPSVTPEPTSTATPSPTTPSQTKQPIGITAEFEGKIPIEKSTGNVYWFSDNVNSASVKVMLKYNDGTEKVLTPAEFKFLNEEGIEKDGKKYMQYSIGYDQFSTVLEVETVPIDNNIVYPSTITAFYTGSPLKKGERPDVNDVKIEVIYSDYTEGTIDVNKIDVLLYDEDTGEYWFVYHYYLEYEGELLHFCRISIRHIDYE